MDFVESVSAAIQVSMTQGSFYSCGPRPADITLVRFSHIVFRHVTEPECTETWSTDVGASQMIIDGKIKLKNDAQISRFTEKGLEFDNGSSLDVDTVIFATGWVPCCLFILSFHFFPMVTVMGSYAFTTHMRSLGEPREHMRKILGPEAGARIKPIWGLDAEGEIKGAWRDIGLPRLWCMIGKLLLFEKKRRNTQHNVGNFALCRFHSTHVALRAFLTVYELIRTRLFRVLII